MLTMCQDNKEKKIPGRLFTQRAKIFHEISSSNARIDSSNNYQTPQRNDLLLQSKAQQSKLSYTAYGQSVQ